MNSSSATRNTSTLSTSGPAPSRWRRTPWPCAPGCCSQCGRTRSPSGPWRALSGQEAYAALRTAYRRGLVELAIKDLCAADPLDFMPAAGAELADLAGAALEAALAVSRAETAEKFDAAEVADVGLAVIGMGKCGARELNYISDVDVIYVIESGTLEDATSHHDRHGTCLRDLAGDHVHLPGTRAVGSGCEPAARGQVRSAGRTLASHESYYARWAESWEFQALLKARTIAGDTDLGTRYEAAVTPLIWSSAGREGFVESVRAMRRRVTEHIPADEEQRQIKLGRGGLRDVEFTVQLLQLVHGKSDETLRCRDTTSAIAALSAGGYIGRSDAAEFDRDYRYLRLLEHRIQLFQLRRTHLMPETEASLRSLAKAVLGPFSAERPKPDALVAAWRKTKRSVRELHERIFYRPLLNTARRSAAKRRG